MKTLKELNLNAKKNNKIIKKELKNIPNFNLIVNKKKDNINNYIKKG